MTLWNAYGSHSFSAIIIRCRKFARRKTGGNDSNSEVRFVTAVQSFAVICSRIRKNTDRPEGAGKACRKRYCQLDWCFRAARRAIIRKGRTTSVHHIWQTFPNMVTSTSKYGSRGRPLVARCTTTRSN